MQFEINGNRYSIPSSLHEITLQQRIDFMNRYGKQLDDNLERINSIEDDITRGLEYAEHRIDYAFKVISFYTGIEENVLKESQFVDELLNIYHASIAVLEEEERTLEHKTSFTWKGEEWELQHYELNNSSQMTFGEFIDAKQIVQDMHNLGKNDWESMLNLACIFFRKKGEKYTSELSNPNGERMKLMRELPLVYALQVGFFLLGSMILYIKHFLSSSHPESKEEVQTQQSILSSGVG